jgi:hypothetical protein
MRDKLKCSVNIFSDYIDVEDLLGWIEKDVSDIGDSMSDVIHGPLDEMASELAELFNGTLNETIAMFSNETMADTADLSFLDALPANYDNVSTQVSGQVCNRLSLIMILLYSYCL